MTLEERFQRLVKAAVDDDNELELAWTVALNLPHDSDGYCTEEGTSGHSLAMRGVAEYTALLILLEGARKDRDRAERKLAELRQLLSAQLVPRIGNAGYAVLLSNADGERAAVLLKEPSE